MFKIKFYVGTKKYKKHAKHLQNLRKMKWALPNFVLNICSVLYQVETEQARQVSAGTYWQLTHRRSLIFNATQTL